MQDDGMTRGKLNHYLSIAREAQGYRWVGLFGVGMLLFVVGAVGSLGQITSLAPGTMPSIWGKSDDQLWAEAFEWADQGQFDRARNVASRSKDQTLAPVLSWVEYRSGQSQASVEEIGQFIDDYPHFPGIRQAEISRQSLLKLTLTDDEMLAYYEQHSPVNFAAQLHRLQTLARSGRENEAASIAARYWRTRTLRSADQDALLEAFGSELTPQDHQDRLKHLITHGARTSGPKLVPLLPQEWQALATAWLERQAVDETIDASFHNHPVFVIPAVMAFDAEGDVDAAFEALESIPSALRLPRLEWRARHIVSRELLKRERFEDALRLVSAHGLDQAYGQAGDTRAEAHWLSGWIAFTRLAQIELAQTEFEKALAAARSSNWKAQSLFWLAMAHEAQGDTENSVTFLGRCAALSHTYYGQQCLAATGQELFVGGLPVANSNLDSKDFAGGSRQSMLRVTSALLRINRVKDATKFLYQLSASAKTPNDVAILGQLAREHQINRTSFGIAWLAADRQLFELGTMLPILDTELMAPVSLDLSLLHAIASRESIFVLDAKSSKGALGLMQVLPATGERMARQLGLAWDEERMTRDAGYNFTIGAAYLDQLATRFDGNLLLAIASYNAGPGNIDRWIADFGNPSDPSVDPEIWVESIPYRETRNYVKDVLARYNLYRAFMNDGPVSLFTPNSLSASVRDD